MNNEQREALIGAVGIIEGVAYFTEKGATDALLYTIEILKGVLNNDSRAEN